MSAAKYDYKALIGRSGSVTGTPKGKPSKEVKPEYPDTPEGRLARRKAAINAAFGMWKGRTDIPTDGLEYQRMMRDEWR